MVYQFAHKNLRELTNPLLDIGNFLDVLFAMEIQRCAIEVLMWAGGHY